MITFGDTLAKAEAPYIRAVFNETWGHLAPKRNKTYKGRIVYAIGCYDSGHLNPTPITVELPGMDDSPYFYEAINEWLQDIEEEFREEGCVYEVVGHFKNYKFVGAINLILNTELRK